MTLDPVDYAIISQALIAAAREMGAKLVRSAFPPYCARHATVRQRCLTRAATRSRRPS